jgi:hypothetical protein
MVFGFRPESRSSSTGFPIEQLLKSKGAGKTCWATSENAELDGKELEVHAALESVVGRGMGTILSFIPGKLAYYEGEDEMLLLAR